MRISIFLLVTVLSFFKIGKLEAQSKTVAYAYDQAKYPSDADVDFIHMKAELEVMPYEGKLKGTVSYDFIPYRNDVVSFSYNIKSITVSSVKLDGKSIEFKTVGNKLNLNFDTLNKNEIHSISFDYEAKPEGTMYFIGWNDPQQLKRKQVWAHGPANWIPYLPMPHHDKLTTELIITVDSKYKVFTNGDRLSVKEHKNSTSTWHYKLKNPTPYGLMVIAIGEYEYQKSVSNTGVSLENWYYPELKENLPTTYKYSEYMFQFLEKELGVKYPWSQYRQVPLVDYLWGAAEGTSSTVYGDFYHQDKRAFLDRSYVNTNCHELAHQWFGNYVSHVGTSLSSSYRWLTESFATYYAKIFMKDIYGEDYYQMEKLKERAGVMRASKTNDYPVSHVSAGGLRIYQKGSWVLDMLRYVIGDEVFKTGINQYLKSHPHGVVETHDLYQAFRTSTGLSLGWFFEQWLLHGGEPTYEVSYESLTNEEETSTHVSVQQTHMVSELVTLFKMPIEFQVHYTDGSFDSRKEMIEKEYHTVKISNEGKKKIAFVLFDPANRILKNVRFKKSTKELEAQLLNAPQMIDRYYALLGLKTVAMDEKRAMLHQSFKKDKFELMRKEVVSQLSRDLASEESVAVLKTALSDKSVKVRQSVLRNVEAIPTELKIDFEKSLKDSSYVNVELALRNLVNNFPSEVEKYLTITSKEEGWRGRNIRISWLELSINHGKSEFLGELVDYSSMSYEFQTRINAIRVLKRINYCNKEVLKNIFHAYLYWNPKLSRVGKEVLIYFMEQNEYKTIIKEFVEEGEWTGKELEKIQQIIQ